MHTNILHAIDECGPGHPSHVTAAMAIGDRCGRIVAIRVGNKPDTYHLTFSDSKVDLREKCDTICNVPASKVAHTIDVFLGGSRVEVEKRPWFDQFINQASRECEVVRLTPTRCRIEYDLPNSGPTRAWRYQTTVGGFTYIAAW